VLGESKPKRARRRTPHRLHDIEPHNAIRLAREVVAACVNRTSKRYRLRFIDGFENRFDIACDIALGSVNVASRRRGYRNRDDIGSRFQIAGNAEYSFNSVFFRIFRLFTDIRPPFAEERACIFVQEIRVTPPVAGFDPLAGKRVAQRLRIIEKRVGSRPPSLLCRSGAGNCDPEKNDDPSFAAPSYRLSVPTR
jgi:hypothetical protein